MSSGIPAASNHFQTIVIGAGVIGLAVSRRFAKGGHEVLLLEKESVVGSGISSRSSEVIHAGIYYPSASLKAKLCVNGRHLIYDYCSSRNIPYKKVGKLIVATNKHQLHVDLPSLLQQAKANYVHDLIFVSAQQVTQEYEPEITCQGALFSPSTGILDSHSFIMSLLADAQDLGVTLVLRSNVTNIYPHKPRGFHVEVDDTILSCDILFNCTGLYSDLVSAPLFSSSSNYKLLNRRQFFAKGNYYRLQQQGYNATSPFRHLIYPIPERFGLGTHATLDLTGSSTRFGPDVEWISPSITHPEQFDYSVDERRADLFYSEIRKYWPQLQDGCLVQDYSGVRPKLVHAQQSNSSFQDFGIETVKDHGIPNFINLRGIESPGLTSCMAIADYVFDLQLHGESMHT